MCPSAWLKVLFGRSAAKRRKGPKLSGAQWMASTRAPGAPGAACNKGVMICKKERAQQPVTTSQETSSNHVMVTER
eukprot:s23_g29.t1